MEKIFVNAKKNRMCAYTEKKQLCIEYETSVLFIYDIIITYVIDVVERITAEGTSPRVYRKEGR